MQINNISNSFNFGILSKNSIIFKQVEIDRDLRDRKINSEEASRRYKELVDSITRTQDLRRYTI